MGVADSGYSTQAVFFDYDRDNDLDLFVINHNNKNLRNFDAAFVKKMVDPDAGDRLYRNDNNSNFTDVTIHFRHHFKSSWLWSWSFCERYQ